MPLPTAPAARTALLALALLLPLSGCGGMRMPGLRLQPQVLQAWPSALGTVLLVDRGINSPAGQRFAMELESGGGSIPVPMLQMPQLAYAGDAAGSLVVVLQGPTPSCPADAQLIAVNRNGLVTSPVGGCAPIEIRPRGASVEVVAFNGDVWVYRNGSVQRGGDSEPFQVAPLDSAPPLQSAPLTAAPLAPTPLQFPSSSGSAFDSPLPPIGSGPSFGQPAALGGFENPGPAPLGGVSPAPLGGIEQPLPPPAEPAPLGGGALAPDVTLAPTPAPVQPEPTATPRRNTGAPSLIPQTPDLDDAPLPLTPGATSSLPPADPEELADDLTDSAIPSMAETESTAVPE